MSCVRPNCEYRVDRNGDRREHGTFCSHPADTVNQFDGQPQCPYHPNAISLRDYERPPPRLYEEEEIEREDFPYT